MRPYFPLIWGMFVFRKGGGRFLFWELEVPELRVRKRPLSLTKMSVSIRTKDLNKIIILILNGDPVKPNLLLSKW